MGRVQFHFVIPKLFGDFIDHEAVRTVANVVFAGDGDSFACEGQQLGVLGRRGRFVVDGQEDRAVIAEG